MDLCKKNQYSYSFLSISLIYIHIKFGKDILLKTNYDGSLAMFCFHLNGQMSKDEWTDVAEQLCQANQLDKLAYLLVDLRHLQQIDFRTSKNSYIYYFTLILVTNDRTISIED